MPDTGTTPQPPPRFDTVAGRRFRGIHFALPDPLMGAQAGSQ